MMNKRPYPQKNRNLKVLYHSSCSDTARAVARELGIGYMQSPEPEHTVVIRWGYSREHKEDLALNTAEAVKLAANGKASLEALQEAGVPCVRLATPEDGIYPLMARCRYNHIGGKFIEYVTCEEEARETGAKYFTVFRKADKELRIHVFGGEVLRVLRKVPRTNTADKLIKTSERGWGYKRCNHERYYRVAQRIAVDAVKALGLHFGGVDMGWSEEDRKYFVFEVNTAPSLNSISLGEYVEKFKTHLEGLGIDYVAV